MFSTVMANLLNKLSSVNRTNYNFCDDKISFAEKKYNKIINIIYINRSISQLINYLKLKVTRNLFLISADLSRTRDLNV